MPSVRLSRPLTMSLALTSMVACTTARKIDTSLSTLNVDPARSGILKLDGPEGRPMFDKMIAVEKDAGIPFDPLTMHASKGRLDCVRDATVGGCGLKTRVAGALAPSQPMDAEFSRRVLAFAVDFRPDLNNRSLIIADVVCDYTGTKVPPFKREDLRCKISSPRPPNEIMIDGREAEEITGLLMLEGIEDRAGSNDPLVGSITCFQVDVGSRIRCNIRPAIRNVLIEKVVELDGRYTSNVFRDLRAGYRDNPPKGAPAKTDPTSITGSLTCVPESDPMSPTGRREYHCRVAI